MANLVGFCENAKTLGHDGGAAIHAFASEAIFEAALGEGFSGTVDWLILNGRGNAKALDGGPITWPLIMGSTLPIESKPLRLIMLEGIYQAARGGLFTQPDPTGVTPWLRSAGVAGALVGSALMKDPCADVRVILLKIIGELAIPAEWAQVLLEMRVFESLADQLPRTIWSVEPTTDLRYRSQLQGLSFGAQTRVSAIAAQAGMPDLAALGWANPLTGDGKNAPTPPPPPKAWYRNGPVLSAGALGLLVGAMVKYPR